MNKMFPFSKIVHRFKNVQDSPKMFLFSQIVWVLKKHKFRNACIFKKIFTFSKRKTHSHFKKMFKSVVAYIVLMPRVAYLHVEVYQVQWLATTIHWEVPGSIPHTHMTFFGVVAQFLQIK